MAICSSGIRCSTAASNSRQWVSVSMRKHSCASSSLQARKIAYGSISTSDSSKARSLSP